MDILDFLNKGEEFARKEKEIKTFFLHSRTQTKSDMTKNVMCEIHNICKATTVGCSQWLAKRVELFSVLYVFQKESLVRKVRNTEFVDLYFSEVCPLNNVPRYKQNLVFLFRRNKEFSQLCKKNITEIEDYINGKNCETDTTPSPTANV